MQLSTQNCRRGLRELKMLMVFMPVGICHDFQVIHPHSLQVIDHASGGKCFIEENCFAHQVRRNRWEKTLTMVWIPESKSIHTCITENSLICIFCILGYRWQYVDSKGVAEVSHCPFQVWLHIIVHPDFHKQLVFPSDLWVHVIESWANHREYIKTPIHPPCQSLPLLQCPWCSSFSVWLCCEFLELVQEII